MNPAPFFMQQSQRMHRTAGCIEPRPLGDELVLMSAAFIWCTLMVGVILLACYLYQKWDRS